MERTNIVKFKGNPLTLIGPELKDGDKAPDFKVLDSDLKEVKLNNFEGKVKVISVTPSLDTRVCDMQARRFNEEAAKLPEDVVVINISMDLPFAISRFCTTAEVDKVKAYSDHRDASFGNAYGVLIKKLRLLARSIFVIDKDNIIKYVEIVPEITEQPKYNRVIEIVKDCLLKQ
ncbi:thiol peroxidase [Candidatus Acetothermia bacterium]|jgi:thiol peroxidase|nr:thiol peroxidase [Candidatus Acetothermia bacterium]MCI2426528.1 thiol peroxidase [Candidatus Acetothermia bacterium]